MLLQCISMQIRNESAKQYALIGNLHAFPKVSARLQTHKRLFTCTRMQLHTHANARTHTRAHTRTRVAHALLAEGCVGELLPFAAKEFALEGEKLCTLPLPFHSAATLISNWSASRMANLLLGNAHITCIP